MVKLALLGWLFLANRLAFALMVWRGGRQDDSMSSCRRGNEPFQTQCTTSAMIGSRAVRVLPCRGRTVRVAGTSLDADML